jgi:ABC-type transport system involved in multi-copper enzyme maturation permease subunit
MLQLIAIVARHELTASLKSRRALLLSGAYLGTALLGGLLYVLSARAIEAQALAALSQAGAADGAATLSLIGDQAYRKAVAFFAGVDEGLIDPVLIHSVILPAFMWGSLVFLPFLVVLTSFDHVTQDLTARSICYPVVRVSRPVLLFGKIVAQLLSFTALTMIASTALVALAFALLETFNLGEALLGLPRAWLVLVPFGACYLGLSTFASTSAKQPMTALILAVTLMLGLRITGWFGSIPESHPLATLRALEWLSPARYHEYLWRADVGPLAAGVLAYLAFFALFTFAALRRLASRDL